MTASVLDLVYDLPNEDYQGHPALSSSGMKTLLRAPAHFKHEQEHPRQSKAFDFGNVWHALALKDDSVQWEVVNKQNRQKEWVEAGDYDTLSAKEHKAEIEANGRVPILGKDLRKAEEMAEAWHADPFVQEHLDLTSGRVEVSAFWTDARTGLPLRCRFDYLPADDTSPYMVIDAKSDSVSEPWSWLRKAMADYQYHVSAALYLRAVREMGLHTRPDFLWLIQEKTAPFIVTPVRATAYMLAVGDYLVDKAIDTYIECERTGTWPGYVTDVVNGELPKWYADRFEGLV